LPHRAYKERCDTTVLLPSTILHYIHRNLRFQPSKIPFNTYNNMYLSVLTSTILPLMALAAPASLSVRQDECTPKLYDLGDFDYSNGPSGSNVTLFFGFQSSFKDPSIINDPAVGRVTCSAKAPSVDSFPNEVECSSGRANLMFDLRAPVNKFNYQIIHTWQCNG
jgi:hypothetical protein